MKNKIKTKIKTLKAGTPIIVEWMDAGYDDNDPISWSNIKQISELEEILIKSIGFFIGSTSNTLFFCMSMEESKTDTNIANKGQVPIGCIKNILILGEK
jgi:hypothetical protein